MRWHALQIRGQEGGCEKSFSKTPRTSGNDSEIYMDDSYISCNYEAIFSQSLCHFQHTFANIE
jgi:hypothetical protein